MLARAVGTAGDVATSITGGGCACCGRGGARASDCRARGARALINSICSRIAGRLSSSRIFQTVALITWIALLPLDLFGAARLKLLLDSPTLAASEKFVLAQVLAGEKPANLGQFGDETNRVLRAAFVEALLTQGGTNVHRNGVTIEHAVILEAFDLRNAEVPCEASFIECRFAEAADFSKSIFEKGFSLAGSSFGRSANFSSMKVGRGAVFDRAIFGAEVNAAQMEVSDIFSRTRSALPQPDRPRRFHQPENGRRCFRYRRHLRRPRHHSIRAPG